MSKNWAIVIGVNQYNFSQELPALQVAMQDAHAMGDFLRHHAQFDPNYIFLLSDNSPAIRGRSTRPDRPNLLRIFNQYFKTLDLKKSGDLWFFYSGHGISHQGKDYLMLADGDPSNPADTAIPTDQVIAFLRRCNARTAVLVLDMCRNQLPPPDGKNATLPIGNPTLTQAKEQGIITIFSCKPDQKSYEIPGQGGAFTLALLEGLKQHTIPRDLNQFLQQRVPLLNQQIDPNRPPQTPEIYPSPGDAYLRPLLRQCITSQDITQLVRAAQTAEHKALRTKKPADLALASQALRQALNAMIACQPELGDILEGIRAIKREQRQQRKPKPKPKPATSPSSPSSPPSDSKSPAAQDLADLFADVPTDDQDPAPRTPHSAPQTPHSAPRTPQQFLEDLGNGITLDMVQIPGGSFQMGTPSNQRDTIIKERTRHGTSQKDAETWTDYELPQHQVTVPAFFMGKTPITQAQWRVVAALPKLTTDLNPDPAYFKGDDHPVEQVNWHEAMEFCARLSKKTCKDYRLPSEAEWEYACRAGTTTPFYFGATITPDLVNYNGNYPYGNAPKSTYREQTTEVGSFPPNAFGLYDLHGTVWEWCADNWHENYNGAPTDGSIWKTKDFNNDPHVLRGGSWLDRAVNCRAANRDRSFPGDRYYYVGFRVVCASGART